MMNAGCSGVEYAIQIITKVRQLSIAVGDHEDYGQSNTCRLSPVATNFTSGSHAVETAPADGEFELSACITDMAAARSIGQNVCEYAKEDALPAVKQEYAVASLEVQAYNLYHAFDGREEVPVTKLVRLMLKGNSANKGKGAQRLFSSRKS
ncbi:hypothetical protein JIQ42_02811 [Leishmania sp. Namibia]|uniref:hypothetical protein n=1 Tax=Leishmania sp. Namibia TaxID=2802991 RepID=UPI001B75D683|nr:hypothetical protein JIQ42_02811 [Leishmania sp. Namibia]